MRAPGLIRTVQLAAVLSLAAPLLFFGVDFLLRGRVPSGLAFIALGSLMLLMQWRLTNPIDPGDLAEAAVDRLAGDGEE